jgi:hypothetical protein
VHWGTCGTGQRRIFGIAARCERQGRVRLNPGCLRIGDGALQVRAMSAAENAAALTETCASICFRLNRRWQKRQPMPERLPIRALRLEVRDHERHMDSGLCRSTVTEAQGREYTARPTKFDDASCWGLRGDLAWRSPRTSFVTLDSLREGRHRRAHQISASLRTIHQWFCH